MDKQYPNTYKGGFDAGYDLATEHGKEKIDALKNRVYSVIDILKNGVKENNGPDRVKLSNGEWLEGEAATVFISIIESTAKTLEVILENS